jgi:membrane protease YdiL (CAAX protease family)
VIALLEVLLCSDYPTQFALGATFAALGFRPFAPNGHLLVGYVVALSLIDTALLIALILVFLHAHGERPRDVLLGARPIGREVVVGILMTFVALAVGVGILVSIQRFAPSLHTVEHNPFQELLRTRYGAAIFALVVIVAGGVREEIQRAFLLHRFDVWLGGGAVGVVITSAAFGAGHVLQGADATIATGLLGAFWGVLYLRRRSAVAPVVSHSGFNVLQILQYLATGH